MLNYSFSLRRCLLVVGLVLSYTSTDAFVSRVPAFATTTWGHESLIIAHSTPTSKDVVDTFRKADFIAEVAEKTGMSKKDSEKALKAVLDVITEQVVQGKRVSLPSFGTFTLKERAARKGRNPQTGEPLDIAASKNPSFSAAKAWKDAANSK